MPDFTVIENAQIDQGSPIDQPLMTAIRDNINAVALHPYDDGTGIIWEQAVDGGVTSITSPTLEAGWEYLFLFEKFNTDGAGAIGIELQLNYDDASNSGYDTASSEADNIPSTVGVWVRFGRKGNGHAFVSSDSQWDGAVASSSTAKVSTVTFRFEGETTTEGQLVMLRRREGYTSA